jgi:hypothetical protein
MPDPNKRKPRLRSRAQVDKITVPKVQKDAKFTGSQRKYSREFLCAVKSNDLTNPRTGTAKFKIRANAQGSFVKRAPTQPGQGHFPTQSEMYKGGMSRGAGSKIPIAQNLQRGSKEV